MTGRCAVVVLNWNGWRDTIHCLEAVLRQDRRDLLLVVVDNASHDGSPARLRVWARARHAEGALSAPPLDLRERGLARARLPASPGRTLVLLRAASNGGYARGNNLGLRVAMAAGARHAWILNNDTEPDRRALSRLLARVAGDPRIGLCGSTLVYFDRRRTVQAIGGARFRFASASGEELGEGLVVDDDRIARIDEADMTYVSGASVLVSADFVADVGPMDEGYFLYYEEIDWALRTAGRWRFAIARDSVVYHKVGSSIGTGHPSRPHSPLAQYYRIRNLIRMYRRHRPMWVPIAVARAVREWLGCRVRGRRDLARVTLRATGNALAGGEGPTFRPTWTEAANDDGPSIVAPAAAAAAAATVAVAAVARAGWL